MTTAGGSSSLITYDAIVYPSNITIALSDVVYPFILNQSFPNLSIKFQPVYGGSLSLFLLIETFKVT